MRNIKTLAAAVTLSVLVDACGGGSGGGSSGGGSSSTGTGTTTTGTSNGTTLLAQYIVPADIAGAVVTNYSGPAFNVGNSGMQSACSGTVSSTVVDAPDVIVFSANGASLKAQELAADLFEQAVPQIRTALGLSASGVAFDGTNKVQLCVDTALGQSSGETGTSLEGQTNLGSPGPVIQIMSADSANFDARYPGATSYTSPVGQSYGSLFVHEGTHAALYSLSEPFGGMETWFQEGMATTVAQQPMGTKASILTLVQGTDVLSTTNLNTNMDAYPAYEATVQYLTSSAAGGLGYGLTNIPTFIAAYKAAAMAACAQPIPNGIIPPASQTQSMPSGEYNVCVGGAGSIDTRVQAAFDTAFNSTFKDSNGSPLLLHTADGANSLEATLYQRLSAFLP
ncbi:hypothetical protein [Burkholderia pseudomultivorans]|uniref:Lipoprotein n=1 Tax=Burkholderia pseudomultivorans TaxID=1207504 RepID=A0ABU2EE83_9BURK|nr:hypothetical protein [Burkholderia pseudomultivorans]MDR8731323.1 hypothetical protein [Burkholderia pseudomultivorans]MDR8738944.1 hypothetical protein [Burkholderia pseudomultivorans]MDR8745495.1 hypothetical protein [Burkholderia pseudomultivorans]MDR8757803.1 hypothetical protein [Burkholderia pseudomultivorans]MDR8781903.1 hypothetical protein [Burkholderia pseudomultivorans]